MSDYISFTNLLNKPKMGFESMPSGKAPEKKGLKRIIKGAALGATLGLAMHAFDAGANIEKKETEFGPNTEKMMKLSAKDLAEMRKETAGEELDAIIKASDPFEIDKEMERQKEMDAEIKRNEKKNQEERAAYEASLEKIKEGDVEVTIDPRAKKFLEKIEHHISTKEIVIGDQKIEIGKNATVQVYSPDSEYNQENSDFIVIVTKYWDEAKHFPSSIDSYDYKENKLIKEDHDNNFPKP